MSILILVAGITLLLLAVSAVLSELGGRRLPVALCWLATLSAATIGAGFFLAGNGYLTRGDWIQLAVFLTILLIGVWCSYLPLLVGHFREAHHRAKHPIHEP